MAMLHSGCRLAPKEEGGPVMNSYTPGFLRSVGLLPANSVDPDVFELAVREAVRRRQRGTITYLFLRDARFEEFAKTWKPLVGLAKAAAMESKKTGTKVLPDFPPVRRTVEELTTEAYMRLWNEQEYDRELPWLQEAWCDASNTEFEPSDFDLPPDQAAELADRYGGKTPFGTYTITGARWTLGLSNEDRAKLGIHPRP